MNASQDMSAAEIGREIELGQIDPVDLTETTLSKIEAHEAGDRIYARLTPDRAIAEAEAARDRAHTGRRLGPLDGVPVSWKDLFDTAGTATEAGSRVLAGRIPESDAEVVRRGTAAGLVCLGKTHMTELAFSGLGLNPMTATPPCVNDPHAAPGGSSSGAAASVAFGLAAAAVGSDTGGSVRVPAAWNDLVGLKTTHGLLSNDGVVPLCRSFDTVGPLTQTVEDAALMFAALGGPTVDLAHATLSGTRFAVIETVAMDDVEDAPQKGFDQALDAIRAAGATIDRIALPSLNDAFDLAGPLYTAEAYAQWQDAVETKAHLMFAQIVERIMGGKSVTAAAYLQAWARIREIRAEWSTLTAPYDAVLCPTCAIAPPNIERLTTEDAYFKRANLMTLRNTRIGNLMGLSGLTIPTGIPSAGLLLNGPPGGEGRLLRLGAAIEAALT
ncbi:amidase [Aestuariibius sp. 2305UL40-4]|uniref:amidase n=1 Tax=Aestuariibius violaceus TaxID=3234132 RepID=UPI00345E9A44